MWGKDEFPYSVGVGDHVEWETGKDVNGGEVVDTIREYDGVKAFQLLVRSSDGYHEVDLDDVYLWEPYGGSKRLDEDELMRLELYKFILKWDLWREPIDEMLDFIFQDDDDEWEDDEE